MMRRIASRSVKQSGEHPADLVGLNGISASGGWLRWHSLASHHGEGSVGEHREDGLAVPGGPVEDPAACRTGRAHRWAAAEA
jgi:hypothetical protein